MGGSLAMGPMAVSHWTVVGQSSKSTTGKKKLWLLAQSRSSAALAQTTARGRTDQVASPASGSKDQNQAATV